MHTPMRFLAAAIAAASLAFALPAAAQQKIKIGFITTLTGPAGIIGKHMKDSVELALEQLGGKMGGVPVEVIFGEQPGGRLPVTIGDLYPYGHGLRYD